MKKRAHWNNVSNAKGQVDTGTDIGFFPNLFYHFLFEKLDAQIAIKLQTDMAVAAGQHAEIVMEMVNWNII